MTKEELMQEMIQIVSTGRPVLMYRIDRHRRRHRHRRQQGWLSSGFFYVQFDYDDGDVLLLHFRTLWHFRISMTFSYFLYYFLRFIFIMLNIIFVPFILMNLQLGEKEWKNLFKMTCIKHEQMWGKREGESCWKLNQERSSS